jgi:hypothetical protein
VDTPFFVKIGNRYLNLNAFLYTEIRGQEIKLVYESEGCSPKEYVGLSGDEAKEMISFLEQLKKN